MRRLVILVSIFVLLVGAATAPAGAQTAQVGNIILVLRQNVACDRIKKNSGQIRLAAILNFTHRKKTS